MKRKICVVITARPSYSRIKTVLREIKNHKKLQLQLVLAASALSSRYGSADKIVKSDGFKVSGYVRNMVSGEDIYAQAKITGLGIIELSSEFERLNPDAVITIADRFETMATAIAASYLNIPLIHIQGGEVTGNIDEKVRHSITKLSDLHFVASQKAEERVIKMGEDSNYVFNYGCPSIDLASEVRFDKKIDFNIYEKYSGVGNSPDLSKGYLVVMQHPVTTEYNESKNHIYKTLDAIMELNIPTLWFWPNVDAGADGTSKGIRQYRESNKLDNVHFFKNMYPDDFLKILKNSFCLIGNSSVGIRECSFLGIPVVNIGSRQSGRARSKNIIDVNYNKQEIISAVRRQIKNGHYDSSKIYGNGDSAKKIAKKIAEIKLIFDKKLMY